MNSPPVRYAAWKQASWEQLAHDLRELVSGAPGYVWVLLGEGILLAIVIAWLLKRQQQRRWRLMHAAFAANLDHHALRMVQATANAAYLIIKRSNLNSALPAEVRKLLDAQNTDTTTVSRDAVAAGKSVDHVIAAYAASFDAEAAAHGLAVRECAEAIAAELASHEAILSTRTAMRYADPRTARSVGGTQSCLKLCKLGGELLTRLSGGSVAARRGRRSKEAAETAATRANLQMVEKLAADIDAELASRGDVVEFDLKSFRGAHLARETSASRP